MARIRPFAGIRPATDKVARMVSPSPDRLSAQAIQEELSNNPDSFLQILFPDFLDKIITEPGSPERLLKTKQRYNSYLQEQRLLRDNKPAYYIYRQQSDNHFYVGIMACTSIDDYRNGVIKVHEATLTDREEKLRAYLEVCGYNAEPVLFAYPDHSDINKWVTTQIQQKPIYDFVTQGNLHHEIWMVNSENEIKILTNYFSELSAIYIADGHHRSASSALLGESKRIQNPNYTGEEPWNFYLGIFFPESQLNILPYHRVTTDLNGLTPEQFLAALSNDFTVDSISAADAQPPARHSFTLYVDKKWYLLTLKPERVQEGDPVHALDAYLLTHYILNPILGISDLKTDTRIGFISGNSEIHELENQVNSGKYSAAFGLFPVQMDELKRIADSGAIMPPKSTWVEPKLKTGLIIYSLE